MKNTKHARKSKPRRQAKSAVPGLNVALLRKVKRHILAEPKRFAMSFYLLSKTKEATKYIGDDGMDYPFAKCGTAGCIAGWATILSGGGHNADAFSGCDALGINYTTSMRLFFEQSWPYKYFEEYEMAATNKERAKIAANRIEHFIKTGK